jgi:hypothetical protein
VAAGKGRGPEWLEAGLGLHNGMLLRNLIIKHANEAAAAQTNDDDAEMLRDWCEDFRASFDFFVADSEVASASRAAAVSAILNASALAEYSVMRREKIISEVKEARAAKMRSAKEVKAAAEIEKTLAAVRAVMKGTNTKPTRGVEYARLIMPKVVKELGRDISPWTIRGHVRAILEEPPGK